MEIKKSQAADLESSGQKTTSMLIGLILILSAMFVAFQWTQRERKVVETEPVIEPVFEEEVIPITQQQKEPIAPPPAAAPPQVAEVINIVDNTKELQESEVQSTEENNQVVAVHTGVGAPTTAPVGVAQEEVDEGQVFQVVEAMPEFPGGMAECMKWLQKNIKYPAICQENGIQGKVIVQFVVNKDGSIVDEKVVRGVDPALDKEAIRVVKLMPRWKPGRQSNKTVRVKFTLPISFRLS